MKIRNVESKDLNEIMYIENMAFPPNEAASRAAMETRIELIPDTFLVACEGEKVLGYVVGPTSQSRYINDELFEDVAPNQEFHTTQTILSLATASEAQGKGVATALLYELRKVAMLQGRKIISLTCLKKLKSFYLYHGYKYEGISASTHGGESWYNMILILDK